MEHCRLCHVQSGIIGKSRDVNGLEVVYMTRGGVTTEFLEVTHIPEAIQFLGGAGWELVVILPAGTEPIMSYKENWYRRSDEYFFKRADQA